MTTREWNIEQPSKHAVRIDHSFWSGRAVIYLDGQDLFRRGIKVWDTGFEHRFKIDGVPCIVRVITRPFHFTYELWVDGKLQ
jgi:hypothetical protein